KRLATCQCRQANRSDVCNACTRTFSASAGVSLDNSTATVSGSILNGDISAIRYGSVCAAMFTPYLALSKVARIIAIVSFTLLPKHAWMTTQFSNFSTITCWSVGNGKLFTCALIVSAILEYAASLRPSLVCSSCLAEG